MSQSADAIDQLREFALHLFYEKDGPAAAHLDDFLDRAIGYLAHSEIEIVVTAIDRHLQFA